MTIEKIIDSFLPISLKEMNDVKLLNRIDTKYMLGLDLLPHILDKIHPYYHVLDINNDKIFAYNSLYYDTDDNAMYLAHHNGKLNRYKIRFRKYISSDLSFIEIKYKIKGTRTLKFRTETEDIETSLSEKSRAYIAKHTPFEKCRLEPKVFTDFSRMTLVNKELTERVTIDLDLKFRYNGSSESIGNVVIIELKRDGTSQGSHLVDTLNHFGVFPKGFSKYCIGRAMLEGNLKYNNFKERLLTINKINDGKYYYRNFT